MDKENSVLIVDDEASNIGALSSILDAEYRLYAVNNGADAVAAAEKHLPDLILLDIIMPNMGGYDVLAALKSAEKTKDIAVIVISGLGDAANEGKALASGAVDYVTKPFSPAVVRHRVRVHIQAVNTRRELDAARRALQSETRGAGGTGTIGKEVERA